MRHYYRLFLSIGDEIVAKKSFSHNLLPILQLIRVIDIRRMTMHKLVIYTVAAMKNVTCLAHIHIMLC